MYSAVAQTASKTKNVWFTLMFSGSSANQKVYGLVLLALACVSLR